MTNIQLLWGMYSFTFLVLFFFIRLWISNLSKSQDRMEKNLEKKLDAALCDERHESMKKGCEKFAHHKHAPTKQDGTGGEVIL